MMRTALPVYIFLLCLSLQSCFKKDDKVTPHPVGDLLTDTIPMTQDYRYQIYFSLDSGKIVSMNIKTLYDLGFECSGEGWHVILNTSNFMKVADLGNVTLGQAYDTTGMKLRFDKSDGNPDSTAIGTWFSITGKDTVSNNHVYAVSRGLDEAGNPLGLYQVVFDSLKNRSFYFRYALLGGGPVSSGVVSKDPGINFKFFSLKTGTVVPTEPPRQSYDLLFTQYTTLLFKGVQTPAGITQTPYPYLVTGVLLNRHLVGVAVDSTNDFFTITRDQARTMNYTRALDAIGWEWKEYNFETGVYTIRPDICYVIRGVSGFYFKLRFIGFYNKDGLKGYPMIEYQRL
ncbi:MAG: HmuY family protein [Bacteroidetes bacterium]|nr:HmuY family protein [Bacteroidota bacterium]